MKLRIAIDLDDTIFDWKKSHERKFKCKLEDLSDYQITKQVVKCKYDRDFWSNLPLLERPDFIPYVYCTKRISSKKYTRKNLSKLNLPIRPIYQVINQRSNKANYIRGVADILIDDSYSNVMQCINSGFPALLITRPHNQHIITKYRIYQLNYNEIIGKYRELF